jgi:hypothetical protein
LTIIQMPRLNIGPDHVEDFLSSGTYKNDK